MQVIKRNGEVADFDPDKIYQAVLKAAQTVYVLTDDLRQNLAQVTKKVVLDLEEAKVERATISMIQSMVKIVCWEQVTSPLQSTISLIACNVIWREVGMVTISQFTCILNKFVKKKSGMQRTSHSFLNRLFCAFSTVEGTKRILLMSPIRMICVTFLVKFLTIIC